MTTSPKIIKQLIEKEIKWCEANRTPGEEIYQDGFIAGLKQALFLVKSKPVVRFDLSASTVATWLHLGDGNLCSERNVRDEKTNR